MAGPPGVPDLGFTFLKPLVENFNDNTAKMIETRRVINNEYHHIVANALAQIFYETLIKEIRTNLASPFWDLPLADLRRFQEASAAADSQVRKLIWQRMSDLGIVMRSIGEKLEKPLVAQSNGNAQIGNPADANASGLMELGKAYEALLNTLIFLHGNLGAASMGIAPLDAALKAKIAPLFTFLDGPVPGTGIVAKMELGNILIAPYTPPWAPLPQVPSNYLANKPGATIAKEFMESLKWPMICMCSTILTCKISLWLLLRRLAPGVIPYGTQNPVSAPILFMEITQVSRESTLLPRLQHLMPVLRRVPWLDKLFI